MSGQAGQVRFVNMNGGTMIQGDVNGDGLADFQIFLDDKVNLTSSDFVL